jgi:uncharacterized membrane protein
MFIKQINSLKNRIIVALLGVIIGMALGILLLVRGLGVPPTVAALILVVAQVVCARLVRNATARIAIDTALIGAILSYTLAIGSWKTVLAAILLAPVCAVLVALIAKPRAE